MFRSKEQEEIEEQEVQAQAQQQSNEVSNKDAGGGYETPKQGGQSENNLLDLVS